MPPLPTLESVQAADVAHPRKARSTLYIAATHWLTAAFAVPIIGGVALSFAYTLLVPPTLLSALSQLVLFSLFGLGFTWLGVWYSATYINAHYRVADPRLIAKRATVVATVIGAASRSIGLSRVNSTGGLVLAETVIVDLVSFVALLAIFYFASLRFIKGNV